MHLSLATPRTPARLPRPVRAFSAGSAYLGRSMAPCKPLGLPQLPSRRRAGGAQPVQASFFGVGAPEAILVGVVALVVFGPKGLAQAAKSLGSTLRSFAPTIREITSVSQELKSTLEQEIGINEIKDELTRPAVPPPRPPPAATSDSLSGLADSMQQQRPADAAQAAAVDPDIEAKRAAAAAAAWGGAAPAAAPPAAAAPAAAAPAGAPRAVEAMSLEELEAELARRKAGGGGGGQVPKQLSADS